MTGFALGVFEAAGQASFLGVVVDGRVTAADRVAPGVVAPDADLLSLLRSWKAAFAALSEGVAAGRAGSGMDMSMLRVHPPLSNPPQLFCTGRNYNKHAVEMLLSSGAPVLEGVAEEDRRAFAEDLVARQMAVAEPFVFMKPVTSIAGPHDDLPLPDFSDAVDWELELAVVMGADCYRVSRDEALGLVAGYMIANDVTARDKVRRNEPLPIGPDWIAAKGAPGFLPLGPLFVPAAFVADPHDLEMRLSLNGKPMQVANTGEMSFDIPAQIAFLTRHARMLPGDILCTGSPPGNGAAHGIALRPGDVLTAEISGLGAQSTRCVAP